MYLYVSEIFLSSILRMHGIADLGEQKFLAVFSRRGGGGGYRLSVAKNTHVEYARSTSL